MTLLTPTIRAQDWQAPVRTVSHVYVRFTLIGVRPDGSQQLAKGTLDVPPDKAGSEVRSIDFQSPAGDRVTDLSLSIEGSSSGGTIHLSVTTIVTAALPRQAPVAVRRFRDAQTSLGGTFLHQVYESPDHESSLVLTLSPEVREIPEFIRPSAGAPILFRVVMSRITESGVVDLENNILRTLGDNPVSYSFKTTPGRSGADSPPLEAPGEDGGSKSEPVPMNPSKDSAGRRLDGPPNPKNEAPRDPPPSAASSSSSPAKNARPKRSEVPRSSPDAAPSAVPTPPAISNPSPDDPDEEIELTLSPKRTSEDILVVEGLLRRRLGGAAGEVSETARKTGIMNRGGVMEILVGGSGERNVGAYKFRILADF